MSDSKKLKLFEGKQVRHLWDEEAEKCHVQIVSMVTEGGRYCLGAAGAATPAGLRLCLICCRINRLPERGKRNSASDEISQAF